MGYYTDMIIVLENIRSILNVGSIFRTADAVGAEGIFLCGYTPGPDNQLERLAKTSLGAESTVPWQRYENALQCLDSLATKGYVTIALESAPGAYNIFEIQAPEKYALIFGNEVEGVSKEVLARSNHMAHIPMYGSKESLNVAVAVGIAVYEMNHKRR